MTYLITEKNGRWQIYAGSACILECEDEETARATVASANALLRQPDCDNNGAAFISRTRPVDAQADTAIAVRYG